MIVVIPSNRAINLKFVEPLIEHGARFFVIDDSEGTIELNHPQFSVFNWGDRKRLLGEQDHAIPRRNGACRSLGFYLAWRESDPGEIIIALDDDCQILSKNFARQVEKTLGQRERRVPSGQGLHFNIFDLYQDLDSSAVFPRGFPYNARVQYQPWDLSQTAIVSAQFNLGLWQGALDINAIDKIRLSQTSFPDARLKTESVLVPPGALISVCAGSMHFRRELIPAVYQLPMNIPIAGSWEINRCGDIWAGFILKRLMDIRGDGMSAGGPLVNHTREAAYATNIAAEHLALLVNEEFLDLLTACSEMIEPGSYLEMMAQLHQEFSRRVESLSPILRAYLHHLNSALGAWIALLRKPH